MAHVTGFAYQHNVPPGVMQNFWTRLASKYGTKKYWQEKGEEAAIVNAVSLSDHN